MGKKKQTSSLGRSIIRDRFGSKRRDQVNSYLHTSEVDDGYDWNKLNLRSITEESSLHDFLATAQMAGTEFTAEKLNIKFVSQEARLGMLSAEEVKKIRQTQEEHKKLLTIPRRPRWDETTTATELDMKEREAFLEWRRRLAELQEIEGLVLTPFEKNLEFWRQLWRVIERSDIVVQIVDGRNPLLFRSEDLEQYVKEVDPGKLNLILVNKADYLTDKQRQMWAAHFDAASVHVAFWSAVSEMEQHKEDVRTANNAMSDGNKTKRVPSDNPSDDQTLETQDDTDDTDTKDDNEGGDTAPDLDMSVDKTTMLADGEGLLGSDEDEVSDVTSDDKCAEELCSDKNAEHCAAKEHAADDIVAPHSPINSRLAEPVEKLTVSGTDHSQQHQHDDGSNQVDRSLENNTNIKNNPQILTGSELIELFKSIHKGKKYTSGITTVGMVGYPNVGKSSTINALLKTKKVPVSATPGRTKHFQTLYLDNTLMLCDCPGLVMPSFVNTKADMVISGILPIDQMRDYAAPVASVCRLIPRQTFENIYGIMIARPHEGEDENRPPTPHELLSAYACMRGFMTHKGIPDYQRAARHILKDFVNGKLLYCAPPPDCDVDEFCPTPASIPTKERAHPQPQPVGSKCKHLKQRNTTKYTSEVDKTFFTTNEPKIGTMGVRGGILGYSSSAQSQTGQSTECSKPWKKHYNRGRREKLRRITSHLDA